MAAEEVGAEASADCAESQRRVRWVTSGRVFARR
jgi:hypothetical protein